MLERRNLFQTSKLLYKNKKNEIELKSTQDTLPFKKIYPTGVLYLGNNEYSKTIEFSDISYQLANDNEKRRLFGLYSALLNSLDPSVKVQLNLVNNKIDNLSDQMPVIEGDDMFATHRREYFEFIENQRSKGNNGIIRHKYLTFSVVESNYKNALRRLQSIENNLKDFFRSMGSMISPLNGVERAEVINHVLNYGQKGYYPIETLTNNVFKEGLEKDYIAPVNVDFRPNKAKKTFKINKKYGATLYFDVLATELSDRVLVDFLEEEKELLISLHIKPVNQQKAIKMVKVKNTALNSIKIDENKKAIERGYGTEILPGDLNDNIEETEKIVRDLQKENERFFYLTFTITVFEDNEAALDDSIFALEAIALKHNCELLDLKYQQEKAFMSALPFGKNFNEVEHERGLTTTSTAVFVPFTTIELYSEDKNPVYYGLNALSNNMIQVSRKALKNPNGLFLGTPGSGKSFSAKREIIDVFLQTNDDIIITDPEGEYTPFVNHLNGQVVHISLNSTNYINPLDITNAYGEGNNPLAYKSDFVLSMMNLIVGTKEGLNGKQKSLVDKAVRGIYRKFQNTNNVDDIPILQDLYDWFREEGSEESKELADSLELYVEGSLDVFNHKTNVDHKNRIICFNIQDLGSNLKDLGMLILQDHVWNRVTANRKSNESTWYYMDEFHVLLKDEQTAAYSVDFWKRFRKYGGVPTGITQNVKDLLQNDLIETILENSDFIYLLNQATGDREILQHKLDISEYEANYITNSGYGEGLIIYNGIILPFKDKFPKNNSLYPVMTTNVEEIKKMRKTSNDNTEGSDEKQ